MLGNAGDTVVTQRGLALPLCSLYRRPWTVMVQTAQGWDRRVKSPEMAPDRLRVKEGFLEEVSAELRPGG